MKRPAALPSANATPSFWLSEMPSNLKGYRSTEDMSSHADVVIIGSGVSGVFAAHSLLTGAGHSGTAPSILMLEARELCSGASGRNGGHCQPALYSADAEITKFEMSTYQYISKLIEELDIDCDWQPRGACAAFYSQEDFDRAKQMLEKSVALTPEIKDYLQLITPESQSPSLKELNVSRAKGAIVNKMATSLWPYKLITRIVEILLQDHPSFNVQTNTPALSIERAGELWRVTTPRGSCTTNQVILATNGYTSHLLPGMKDIIEPVRGNMIAGRGGVDLLLNHSYGLVDGLGGEEHKDLVRAAERFIGDGEYLMQRPAKIHTDGEVESPIIAMGGARFMIEKSGYGLDDDSVIDKAANEFLRKRLGQVLDSVAAAPDTFNITHEWSGILGYSKDGFPWVGELQDGLWICGAYSGHGMPQAALCAKHLATVVHQRLEDTSNREDSAQLQDLVPARFLVTTERLQANGVESGADILVA